MELFGCNLWGKKMIVRARAFWEILGRRTNLIITKERVALWLMMCDVGCWLKEEEKKESGFDMSERMKLTGGGVINRTREKCNKYMIAKKHHVGMINPQCLFSFQSSNKIRNRISEVRENKLMMIAQLWQILRRDEKEERKNDKNIHSYTEQL